MQTQLRETERRFEVDLRELRGSQRLHRLQRLERQALLVVNALALQLVRRPRARDRAGGERTLLAQALHARVAAPDLGSDRVVQLVPLERRLA